jgi:hypothetical protein
MDPMSAIAEVERKGSCPCTDIPTVTSYRYSHRVVLPIFPRRILLLGCLVMIAGQETMSVIGHGTNVRNCRSGTEG